jgi:hypothetical protein
VSLSLSDAAGLVGALLILAAFAGVQFQRLDPLRAPALLMNLCGAGLVLASLYFKFNLAAALLEGAWALIALWGLARLAFRRRPG